MHAVDASSRSLSIRVWAFGALVVGAILLFAPAKSALGATHDLSNACPGAPSGWTSPPSNPKIWGPEQDPGTTQENVNCWYFNSDQKTVMVTAQFALPSDLNPIDDFYFGCGPRGTVSWDPSNRQYRVTSPNRWLYVGFNDEGERVLSDSEVTAFENVSKTLLKNTEDVAHTCTLKTVPTATKAGWLFDFEFSISAKDFIAYGGIGTHQPAEIGAVPLPDGTFTTIGGAKNPKVGSVSTPPILVAIVDKGQKKSMTLKIVKGLSYNYKLISAGIADGQLKAKIRVTKSTEPSCPKGSTGTITVASNPAAVTFDLCGALFRHPSRKSSVTIQEN